ncbi:hypothetical protein [Sorangium sp. So ce1078]|uniref:hypothetical protein n=1 Tax=Sorangium sp. So ce1078 TaxID=3133329 RepID=UPI003F5D6C43
MPLGDDVPAWKALRDALGDLVARAGAVTAAVIDESNNIWCAWPVSPAVLPLAARFAELEVAHRAGPPLRRGGRLSVARPAAPPEDAYLAESFGGIYVLVLWFEGPFDAAFQRARLRRELPRIEALTIGLPPPDGPEASEGAAKLRA